MRGQMLIKRGQSVPGVHHQAYHIGLGQGGFGLAQDGGLETAYPLRPLGHGMVSVQSDPARVHQGERPFGSGAHHALHTVPRDAGPVVGDGALAADQTVEQSGLAHVGASQKKDFGHHRKTLRAGSVFSKKKRPEVANRARLAEAALHAAAPRLLPV